MPYKWLAFSVVSIGLVMGTMDMSGVTVALPKFSSYFGESPQVVVWLVLAYTLTFTGFTMTAGRIADVLGRKRVYMLGFGIFTIGLILSSISQEFWQLFACRVFQAMGGAMLVSNVNALISDAFPEAERGKALGLVESVVGAGLMMGPLVGGFLLDLLDWRAIFYVRIPIGVLGLILSWAVLRDTVPSGPRPRFDIGGALTLFLGMVCFLTAINQGHRVGWGSPLILGLLAAAGVVLTLFFIIELRVEGPVFDLRMFKQRTFAAYNLLLVTFFIPSVTLSLLIPFYAVEGQGYTASAAGLFLTIVPIMMFLLSPFTGVLSDRMGSWAMTTAGLALQAAGFFLISRLGGDSSVFQIALGLLVVGVGAGLFLTPTYSAVLGATPPGRLGTASALIAALRSIGTSTGQATAATIFAIQRETHAADLALVFDDTERARQALFAGFQDTVLIMGSVAVLGVGIAVFFARTTKKAAPELEEAAAR